MSKLLNISNWPEQRWPWVVLFISSLGLELSALYFQYVMDLRPCIMCIYQRTAIFGIMLAAIPGMLFYYQPLARMLAYTGWGISAIWGGLIAYEHVDIQQASAINPFFTACEIVPNFPSWLQLHEWLPAFFGADGDCGNIDWQFVGMSMPQWMIVIFAIYSGLFALVLAFRLISKKAL